MPTVEQAVEKEWEQYQESHQEVKVANVLLLGRTGAGKSSLVNRVFGTKVTTINDVKPETEGFDNPFSGKDYGIPMNIFDTAGYELNQADSYYNCVHQRLTEDLNGLHIHLVWYCLAIPGHRIEEMDIEILKKLMGEASIRKRLCVIFTKCDEDDENSTTAEAFKKRLRETISYSLPCYETSDNVDYPFDLDKLVNWSANCIDDEDVRRSFIGAQKISLELKKKEAKKIIAIAATAAGAAGATPLPIADAALLVPIQVGMVTKILDVYGIVNAAGIAGSIAGDAAISAIGKSIAKAAIACIPVAGWALRAAISAIDAAVASSITTGMGVAFSEVSYQSTKKYLNGEEVLWDKIFTPEAIKTLMQIWQSRKHDDNSDELDFDYKEDLS